MKNISLKWLAVSILAYVLSSILIGVIFSISVMFIFDSIPPEQLTLVEPSATIFRIGEPVIGFIIALSIAKWLCDKTRLQTPHTVWAFALFLTLYGLVSIVVHQDLLLATAIPKVLAPWIIAFLALNWSRHVQSE
ncbi:MAG: hypothetical protein WEA82_08985 [Idiomarina sp.]